MWKQVVGNVNNETLFLSQIACHSLYITSIQTALKCIRVHPTNTFITQFTLQPTQRYWDKNVEVFSISLWCRYANK